MIYFNFMTTFFLYKPMVKSGSQMRIGQINSDQDEYFMGLEGLNAFKSAWLGVRKGCVRGGGGRIGGGRGEGVISKEHSVWETCTPAAFSLSCISLPNP